MHSIRIKELVPQDRDEDKQALLPVFLEIWNAPENLKYLSFTLKPFEAKLIAFWLDNHKAQGGRYFCALNEHEEILGILVAKASSIEGFEIYAVGVLPTQKGKGIGRELIAHAVHLAESSGFKDITALVFADNVAMLRLLLSFAFIPVGMEYHKRADGADMLLLKKYL